MAKVIVERPRLGPRRSSRRPFREKNYNIDDVPSKLGVRMRHAATFEQRTLNENLSPLKRYLAKQVGRPWNCVYRDICASLRPTSAVQQHVRQHVWDYVARYVSIAADSSVLKAQCGTRR